MLYFRRFMAAGLMFAICCCAGDISQAAKKRGVMRKLSLIESARTVQLFDGIESGEFTTRVAVQDEKSSTVYISNETDEPLTVELPQAVAGVHVLKQFQPIGSQINGNQQNSIGGNGQGQTVGGQMNPTGNQTFPGQIGQQNNNGNFNFNQGGPGFFSIPPEATVALQLDSVCLQHGKKNPTAAMKYVLRPIETFTTDPTLLRLLSDFDPAKRQRNSVQAAAWNLASDMSWDELRSKPRKQLGRPVVRWFAKSEIETAQKLVVHSTTGTENKNTIARSQPSDRVLRP